MTNLSQSSPFDSIRHEDNQGEYWLATELLALFGYKSWKRQKETVERAVISCQNAGNNSTPHFVEVVQMAQIGGSQAYRSVIKDYRLSRLGCYLTAMNGDPRKSEIAAAQGYFAIKTREAEVVVPQQDAELERLKIQLAIAQANAEMVRNERQLFEQRKSLYEFHGEAGLLRVDGKAPVEIEKPVIETIDEQHKVKFKGQTFPQIVEYLQKRHGVRLKNGGTVKKLLKSADKDDLIAQIPRVVLQEYVPQEHLDEVYRVLSEGNRQMLIGE